MEVINGASGFLEYGREVTSVTSNLEEPNPSTISATSFSVNKITSFFTKLPLSSKSPPWAILFESTENNFASKVPGSNTASISQ